MLLRLSAPPLVILTMIYISTDDLVTPYLTLSVSQSVGRSVHLQSGSDYFIVKSRSEELQE